MRLSSFDDYPFHQAPTPYQMPATTDTHYNDGYWFAFYADGWYFCLGLRLHPNSNCIDGFASVTHGGRQRSLRASRALRPVADDLSAGPLRVEILDPMRKQHLTVSSNEAGIEFDVVFEAIAHPYVEDRYQHVKYGVVVNDMMRYTQVARATGTARSPDGEVAVDSWHAIRDHSWGVRSSMGPPTRMSGTDRTPEEADERAFRIWVPFECGDHSGFFHTHEDRTGRTLDVEGRIDFRDGRSVGLTGVKHSLDYLPGTKHPTGGWIELMDTEGATRRYELREAGGATDVQGFGYYNGWHDGRAAGNYRGALAVEHDVYETSTGPEPSGPPHVDVRKRMDTTEYPCVMTGPDGESGMAHLEHHVFGAYEPYGFTK
jgi:hypothetical protein